MAGRLSSERWQVLAPHLDRAFDLAGDERSSWLAALRQEDPTLAGDVESLLEQHRSLDAAGFLAGGPLPVPGRSSLAGQALGAYTLLAPLGQGGMGTVWLAERNDGRFEGRSAVKLLNASLIGRDAESRFKREGSILARLRHAHIAQLIDAGLSPAGQPYLVLEYVDGQRIDHYCDVQKLDVAARVRLFLDVLEAVAHAHTNLVVHRDIKPSNVMVGADGCVKLLDFGIAKLLTTEAGDVTAVTREGHQALTPEYAAPEQLTGGDVTTATDVYALGVLLYVLLTGRHPSGLEGGVAAHLLQAIVSTEPVRLSDAVTLEPPADAAPQTVALRRATTPRKLRLALRGDLDNIVAKTLKKSAPERYPSAEGMADDLRRYLDQRPVRARADSLAYRTRKFVARNRAAIGAALIVVLALVSGSGIAVWQARAAARQRDRALVQLSRAEATNDLSAFLLSEATPSVGRPITNAELLARGEALVERRFASEPALQAHMLLMLSERYHENDQFDRWQATVERAFTLSRGNADVGLRSRAACVQAAVLDDQGHEVEADSLLSGALRDLSALDDAAADETYCRVCEANMANRRGDSARGVAAALRAVQLEERRSGPAGRGFEALFLLANGYLVAQRSADSDAVFQRLMAMLEQQGLAETRDAALVLNNWSAMLQNAGQHLRAVGLSERAVRIARARDSEHGPTLVMLRSYASALCAVGRCAEAATVADEALVKAPAAGSPLRRYMALSTAASVHAGLGDLARATDLLHEAAPLLDAFRTERPEQQAVLERRQAELALLHGDRRAAQELALRAAGRQEDLRVDPDAALQVLLVLARAQNECGAFDAAQATAERGLASDAASKGMAHSAWEGQLQLERGVALAGRGELDAGRTALRLALEHLQASAGPDAPSTRRALLQLERAG
jgi:eukaryotic-like serine/threonine-protein kinase